MQFYYASLKNWEWPGARLVCTIKAEQSSKINRYRSIKLEKQRKFVILSFPTFLIKKIYNAFMYM